MTRNTFLARESEVSIVLQAGALTTSGITAPTGAALSPPDQIHEVLRNELGHNTTPTTHAADRRLKADPVAPSGQGIDRAVAAAGRGHGCPHRLEVGHMPLPRQPGSGVEPGRRVEVEP